jgi:hypothetical protein
MGRRMEERWRQMPMVGLSAFEIVGRRGHRGCVGGASFHERRVMGKQAPGIDATEWLGCASRRELLK